MRMIRWMCGLTRLDRIRNVAIRERVAVAPLEEKLRETILRWLVHIKRSVNAPVRRCETISLSHIRRGLGCPKMSWNDVIRSDMKSTGLRRTWQKIETYGEFGLKLLNVGSVL